MSGMASELQEVPAEQAPSPWQAPPRTTTRSLSRGGRCSPLVGALGRVSGALNAAITPRAAVTRGFHGAASRPTSSVLVKTYSGLGQCGPAQGLHGVGP